MRRLPLLLSVIAVVGLALTFNFPTPASEAGASPAMQNRPINMTIGCAGDDVDEVRIVPWTVRLSKRGGERATFRLQQASDVEFVIIQVKSGSSWPFETPPTPDFRVPRGGGNAVTTGAILSNAQEGTYFYNIVAVCGSDETVVDPRMRIDP
ncbi:MAG: hypothetical protein IH849_00205 [Acidobacteria bacterium]|nr:hypothetical protein [Acidobacteriota bacterium]